MRKNKLVILVFVLMLIVLSGCSSNTSQSSSIQKEEIQTEFTIDNNRIVLEKKQIIDDKLEIFIPQTFSLMSEETAKLKYPSENRPKVIYTNEDATINITFTYSTSKVSDETLGEMKAYLKNNFDNLYPSATWYEDEIETINGKKVGVFELLTPAVDTQIYNLMFFFELDGRLMIGSFNCTEKQMEGYKPIARNIVNSLVVK